MMSEPEDETNMHPETRSASIEKAVWLITGCSTGFGRQLAKHVLERGYRTVVTARNPQQVDDLAAAGDALVLKLNDRPRFGDS
jgi:NAD(P)-dependent dehydrogenase (short-subunit alcohol dehydrogenase family)